jgi:ribonuclease P protein component
VTDRAGESFPRQNRLTRAKDYSLLFENNFRLGDASMTILVGKIPGDLPRLGFAIAKKQIPKAIQRNRLKRVFRESFRTNRHRLPNHDIVIMVRRSILKLDPVLLNSSLEKHWNAVIKQCEKF